MIDRKCFQPFWKITTHTLWLHPDIVVKTTFCIERFLWCLKIYIVCMFQKKLQTIPRQNFGVSFLKMLAHFILLKYRLILCLLRSFKRKQKNYETRQGMQRRCNHLLYNVQFSPFYPCHINLNILKRKKLFLPIYNFAYYVISKHWFPFVF